MHQPTTWFASFEKDPVVEVAIDGIPATGGLAQVDPDQHRNDSGSAGAQPFRLNRVAPKGLELFYDLRPQRRRSCYSIVSLNRSSRCFLGIALDSCILGFSLATMLSRFTLVLHTLVISHLTGNSLDLPLHLGRMTLDLI